MREKGPRRGRVISETSLSVTLGKIRKEGYIEREVGVCAFRKKTGLGGKW